MSAERLGQCALAVVLAVISALLMVTTHRVEIDLLGVRWPAGLAFGAAFQTVCCVVLFSVSASRLPLVVLGSVWGVAAMPFLGRGRGGGVLLPAVIGDQVQYSGWVLQGLGILIPFAAVLVITLSRRRRAARPPRP